MNVVGMLNSLFNWSFRHYLLCCCSSSALFSPCPGVCIAINYCSSFLWLLFCHGVMIIQLIKDSANGQPTSYPQPSYRNRASLISSGLSRMLVTVASTNSLVKNHSFAVNEVTIFCCDIFPCTFVLLVVCSFQGSVN